MPFVNVKMLEGRTAEQKKELVKAITAAMVDTCNAKADGTMVVIEDAAERIDEEVLVTITNAVQTSAGRLVFAKASPEPPSMRDAATKQERHTGPGPKESDADRDQ